jgi:23S rRNA pseudouridine1911/1915/1917 synthase
MGQSNGTVGLVVPPGASLRLDSFLVKQVPGMSRRAARELLEQGLVRVNGRAARKGHRLNPSDLVTVAPRPEDLAEERSLPLVVLQRDDHFIAVDKPSGVPAVALRPEDRGTLANLILARHPELRGIGRPLECGAVHRLDTGTSGVMLFARNADAYTELRRQFRSRAVAKQYLALVAGSPPQSGRIAWPVAHDPRVRSRMLVCRSEHRARRLGARPAATRYRTVRSYRGASLLAISISTGVRHQIRVHLASLGSPVAGDLLYGKALARTVQAPRLMLHARRIRFRHPTDKSRVVVHAGLPEDFGALLRGLDQRLASR